MVGYVLLISIAIALSTAVFFYLKLYLPSDNPECDQDIKLSIDYASCTIDSGQNTYSIINLNITNRGLFKVDGAYIKIGNVDRAYKETLNNVEEGLESECNPSLVLNPGETFCGRYNYNSAPSGVQEITVQPVVWIDNKPVLCEALVSKRISCA